MALAAQSLWCLVVSPPLYLSYLEASNKDVLGRKLQQQFSSTPSLFYSHSGMTQTQLEEALSGESNAQLHGSFEMDSKFSCKFEFEPASAPYPVIYGVKKFCVV